MRLRTAFLSVKTCFPAYPARLFFVVAIVLGGDLLTGCAIHYFDPKTGAEHIWGVGHMVMKASAANEGHRALVRGTEVIGFTVGMVGRQSYVTAGWERRQQIDVVDDSTAIRFEWPNSSFFKVRVGSEWPHVFEEPRSEKGGNE